MVLFGKCLNVCYLKWKHVCVSLCVCVCVCVHVCSVAQWCPTLCNLTKCSRPGSSVHGIIQARILEWVAMPSSTGSSWSMDRNHVSCIPELAGGFFTTGATWEAPCMYIHKYLCLLWQRLSFSRMRFSQHWIHNELCSPHQEIWVGSCSGMFRHQNIQVVFWQDNHCLIHMEEKIYRLLLSSVQFSCSVMSDFLWPHDCSTPGLPVLLQLLEFTQTHVHWVGDAIQPSHLLSSPSPPALNPSKHQGLLQWVSSSHQVAKVLEFQLQHQSFHWTPRTDL